ncbi:MAG TPA: UDP-N-acetylglucosamine 2-epimerase, partial [Chryseolinea sp.]
MKITIVAGARPNFIKIAALIREIKMRPEAGLHFRLVHTGQHYDQKLSQIFFEELQIPAPDVNLTVGSGSQAEQTGRIMIEFEKDLIANPTDMVIVVGDVNSTMACTIVAKKLQTKVAHIEAGIRSFDYSMPEEVNRIVTDALADYYFTTSSYANDNLRLSGIDQSRIFFVGNIMIDTLIWAKDRIKKPDVIDTRSLKRNG